MANFIKLLFLENDLIGSDYVEPFAGGGTVALTLLYEEYANRVIMNDLDPAVYSFWRSILDQTELFCHLTATTPLTMTEWERQRGTYRELSTSGAVGLELGFSAFYLNRTNRSGIIGGGPIGGPGQSGKWKMDARFNRHDLCRRIRKAARYADRIELHQIDARLFIEAEHNAGNLRNSLTYLDPPYFEKGRELYANWYAQDDHEMLADTIVNLDAPWIVSYDNVAEIRDLYPRQRRIEYNLTYSAADRYSGSEVMFISPCLKIPPVEGPTGIRAGSVDAARLKQLA